MMALLGAASVLMDRDKAAWVMAAIMAQDQICMSSLIIAPKKDLLVKKMK